MAKKEVKAKAKVAKKDKKAAPAPKVEKKAPKAVKAVKSTKAPKAVKAVKPAKGAKVAKPAKGAKSEVMAVREKSGLNQSDFWKTVGVTQSGGSRYENGRAMPKPVAMLVGVVYQGKSLPKVK